MEQVSLKFKAVKYVYLTLVCLVLIIAIFTASDQISELRINSVCIGSLSVAILLAFLNIIFSIKRFQSLLPKRIAFVDAARPHLVGFLANYGAMVPGLGSGVKFGLLKAQNTSTKNAAKVLGFELVLDLTLCTLISLVLGPILFSEYFRSLTQQLLHFDNSIFLVVVLVASLTLIFGFKSRFRSNLGTSIRSIFYKEGFMFSVLFTLLMWMCFAGTLEFLLKSFHEVDKSTYSASMLSVSSSYLAGLLSLIPSGFGVRELSGAYIISNNINNYTVGDAVVVMVVLRVLTVIAGAVALAIISTVSVNTIQNKA